MTSDMLLWGGIGVLLGSAAIVFWLAWYMQS